MKNKYCLILLMALFIGMTSCNAKKNMKEDFVKPDSTVYKLLGKRLTEILFSPSKVYCYTLMGKDTIARNDVVIEGSFVRDSFIEKLDDGQISILQYLLLSNEENYRNDSLVIRSPYIPILEFEFIKKKDSAHVIISLQDRTWSVVYDDKTQFNWNFANKKLIQRYCSYYLNKREVKK